MHKRSLNNEPCRLHNKNFAALCEQLVELQRANAERKGFYSARSGRGAGRLREPKKEGGGMSYATGQHTKNFSLAALR